MLGINSPPINLVNPKDNRKTTSTITTVAIFVVLFFKQDFKRLVIQFVKRSKTRSNAKIKRLNMLPPFISSNRPKREVNHGTMVNEAKRENNVAKTTVIANSSIMLDTKLLLAA